MESINRFKRAISKFLRKKNKDKNQLIVNGWYKSYQPLEKYAFNDSAKEKVREDILRAIAYGITPKKSYRLWWAVSAAAVTLVGSLALWFNAHQIHQNKQVYLSSITKTGIMKYLRLTDGTEVWLNASTTLKYPNRFSSNSREVELPEGEAFFKVKRDVARPFKIHAGKLEVKVLGTSFDINNYSDINTQTIVVNTGKVQISANGKVLAVLSKGNQLAYNKRLQSFELDDVNESDSFSWRDGKTILRNASFADMASVFKSWYGIKLESKIAETKTYSYNLTIQRQISLEDNLALICKMHHINYRKEGTMVVFY